MKNIFKTALMATCLAAAAIPATAIASKEAHPGVHASAPTSTKFYTYWLSWAQGNHLYQYPNLDDVPQGVDTVLVAFGLEKPDHTGITLQSNDQERLKKDIAVLHDRHMKVLLSSGGATAGYPWEDAALTDEQVAKQFIDFTDEYKMDGIDFDIEAGKAERLPHIVELIKAKKPDAIITITLAIDSTGINTVYVPVTKQLFRNKRADSINCMNYDQYWNPPTCSYEKFGSNNCYLKNVQAVVQQMQEFTQLPADQARQKVIMGLMIGVADDKKVVDLDLAKKLTAHLKGHGYGGVMTWDVNRDQPGQDIASTTGLTTGKADEFTNAIIEILK